MVYGLIAECFPVASYVFYLKKDEKHLNIIDSHKKDSNENAKFCTALVLEEHLLNSAIETECSR